LFVYCTCTCLNKLTGLLCTCTRKMSMVINMLHCRQRIILIQSGTINTCYFTKWCSTIGSKVLHFYIQFQLDCLDSGSGHCWLLPKGEAGRAGVPSQGVSSHAKQYFTRQHLEFLIILYIFQNIFHFLSRSINNWLNSRKQYKCGAFFDALAPVSFKNISFVICTTKCCLSF
jgi:hypothetical protein